jgi:autotransporter-associated beta strand protein
MTMNGTTTGLVSLDAANTYTGANTLTAGTLSLDIDSTGSVTNGPLGTNTLTINGGTLQTDATHSVANVLVIGGNFSIGGSNALTLSGAASLTGNRTITVDNSADTTLAGVISESGGTRSFTKAGTGTLILTASNTYNGATTVNAGTLRLSGSGRLSNSSAVVTANVASAVMDFNSVSDTVGSIAGGGGTGGNILLGTATLTAGGDDSTTSFDGVLGTAAAGGNFIKAGNGTLTLSNANVYTGTTTVNAGGTLKITNALGLGTSAGATSIVSGGALELSTVTVAAENISSISGTGVGGNGALVTTGTCSWGGSITPGAAFSIAPSNTFTISGVIGATAFGMTKRNGGTLILTNTNTYTGTTTVNGGMLRIGSGGALDVGSAVTVNAGAAIGGLGTVNGSLTLTGVAATLAPGDGTTEGTFSTGALTLDSDSILTYELNTTGTSDQCAVTGNLTLDGTINCTDGGAFAGVGSYPIITYTGTLTDNTLTVGTMPGGYLYAIVINTTPNPDQVELQVSPAGITVSGHVYSNETGTALAGVTVKSRSNGTTRTAGAATDGAGAFSIATVPTGGAGGAITIWIDGAAQNGATVTRAVDASTNITTLDIYQNRLIVRHEDATAISNAKLDNFDDNDNGNNGDLPFTVTANNLTVYSGTELHVWTGDTYLPGGTVTTDATGGDLHVDDNAVCTMDTATSTIGRDVLVDTGATMRFNANTVINGGDITTAGTGTVTTTAGTPTVSINGTGSVGGGSVTTTIHALSLGPTTTGTTTLATALALNDDLTLASGHTLTAAGLAIGIAGDWTDNGGTFTHGNNVVTFNSTTAAQAINGTDAAQTFYDLTVDKTGQILSTGGSTVTLSAHDFTLTNGTFSAPATFNVSETWSKAGGTTFTHNNGEVVLNGTTQTIVGSTTFYKLTDIETVADTLTFTNGTTQTVSNICTLKGASGQLLSLRSSSNGVTWTINPDTTVDDIQFVDVKDSINSAVAGIDPANSVNSYGNTNWFTGLSIVWAVGTTGKSEGDVTAITWALGSVSESSIHRTDTAPAGGDTLYGRDFIVRNTRDAAETITVDCGNSTTWSIAAAAGLNAFMMGVNTDNSATYSSMDSGGVVVNAALGANTTQTFDLRFQAPSAVTNAGVSETIPVTVTASP